MSLPRKLVSQLLLELSRHERSPLVHVLEAMQRSNGYLSHIRNLQNQACVAVLPKMKPNSVYIPDYI